MTPWRAMAVPRSTFSIQDQVLSRNVERFRGGLVSKAHRLLYDSTLGSRVIMEKRDAAPARARRRDGRRRPLQGYIADQKHPPPRTLQ